nr:DUF6049 family protein [Mobiluncus sp. Marseille-Q7826]
MRRSIPFISRVFLGLAALSVVSLAGGTSGLAQAQTEKPSPTPSASPCTSATSSRSAPAFCGSGFNHQGVHLEITAMTPIVTPDTTELTVNALLEVNSDYHQASSGTLRLEVSTQTPVTREELNQWMDARDNDARLQRNLQTVSTQQITHLTAGKPQQVTLHVPVKDLPLAGTDRWGPRPLTLTFVPDPATSGTNKASGADLSHISQDRSFLLWDSGAAFKPSELLSFVPLTTTRADVLAADRALPNLGSRPNQRLVDVCALADTTPLTLVYDPFLIATELNGLDAASRLLNLTDTTPSPGTEPRPTVAPLRELLAAGNCGQQPPAYLPPGDFGASNTSWLAPAAQDLLRTTAVDLGTKVTQRIPDYQGNLVLWPDFTVSYSPTGDVAQEVATWGNHPLLLSPDSEFKESAKPPAYDADSRKTIKFSEPGDVTAAGWTLDADLSRLLNGKPALDAAQIPTEYRLSAVGARQWALASTAVLTRQRPFAPRLFAAGADRDYSATPAQKAVMQGLGQARWLSFPAWNTVLPQPDDNAAAHPRTVTVPAPSLAGQNDSHAFSTGSKTLVPGQKQLTWFTNPTFAAADNLRAGSALSSAVSDPGRFNSMFSALQVASACATCSTSSPDGSIWAGKSSARHESSAASKPAQSDDVVPNTIDPDISATIFGLINSQPASVINLIDKTAQLPISVSNGWDQAVSVRLKLTPTDTRLQFDPVETLTIAPHSIGQFRIPVKAVGSGDVQVTVQLTNPEGQSIGTPETIRVRVRAEWESTGTYIVAGLLAAVLVFGIVRRIVKGPKNRKLKTGDQA